MSRNACTEARRKGEEGFTLIELMVAMLIAGIALVALAGALAAGLKTVAVQKARTQGNEIATEGIEDLQRYDYDHLGVCATAPSPPAGFDTAAPLANCTSPVYAEPCTGTSGANLVPDPEYTCTRRGIEYTILRYVAYGDAAQTSKRLAVVVEWRDTGGRHQVSQQSSLRSPTQSSVIGVSPPSVTTATVNPSPVVQIAADGQPDNAITLQATTQGMSTADSVVAHFKSLEAGELVDRSVALTTVDGIVWSKVIDASTYRFATGSQFFYFNAVRTGDGKGNSRVATPANKFCAPPDTSCGSSSLPQFTSMTVPGTVDIDPAGILAADVPVSAVTTNLTSLDRASMVFQTQAGAYTVALQVDPSTSCTVSSCSWTGKIAKTAGYRFYAGTQRFYFTAAQEPVDPTVMPSTGAGSTTTVVFG